MEQFQTITDPKTLNGGIIYIMNMSFKGYWLNEHGGSSAIITRHNPDTLVSDDYFKYKLHYKNNCFYFESIRNPGAWLNSTSSGAVYLTPNGYPWDQAYFQWDINPINPSDYSQGVVFKSRHSNAHMRTGSVVDDNSVDVIHKGTATDAYALWYLAAPTISDSKVVVSSYFNNSSLDFNFEFTLNVGIENTKSETVSKSISSEIGTQFKAFSASLSYSQNWESSESQTFSVSHSSKFNVNVPPGKGVKILQLTGNYGYFNIKSNLWDSIDWNTPVTQGTTAPINKPVYIESAVGGVCIHLEASNYSNDATISTWAKLDSPNLKWIIQPSGDGHYFICASANPTFVLHQSGASTENDGPITLWDKNGLEGYQHLKVDLVPTGAGLYYIKFVHSGKGIHLPGSSLENGTLVTQWECLDQNNLKWKIYAA